MKMKKLALAFGLIVAAILSGCAGPRLVVKKDSELFKIKKVKDVPETHPGTVLFVNRSTGIWQRCLVFEGSLSKQQILGVDYTSGQFKLDHIPVGYFEVGPAVDGQPVTDKTELVGFFLPRNDYTVLCFLEGFDGKVLDIQTINVNYFVQPPGERFYYYSILGITMAERFVNHYQFLPQWYQYYGTNTVGLTININDLLHRLIHAIGARDQGPEVVDDK